VLAHGIVVELYIPGEFGNPDGSGSINDIAE
jgi:hypothetical protein